MAGADLREWEAKTPKQCKPRHKVPMLSHLPARNIYPRRAFLQRSRLESAMISEIQKIDAAARMAMAHFEESYAASSERRTRRFLPAWLVLAVVAGLAVYFG